jgi:SPP1 family predicted phage head-tail adaptor
MGRKMTRLGELTERIELRRATRATDNVGGFTETVSTYATVWAKVVPLSGREAVEAGRLEGTASYLVTIHNREDVQDGDVVRWRSRDMNVRFVRRVSSREQFLSIEASLGSAA